MRIVRFRDERGHTRLGELAVVAGRAARDLSPEEALECVKGYTCANDVTARDCQRSDKQRARAEAAEERERLPATGRAC